MPPTRQSILSHICVQRGQREDVGQHAVTKNICRRLVISLASFMTAGEERALFSTNLSQEPYSSISLASGNDAPRAMHLSACNARHAHRCPHSGTNAGRRVGHHAVTQHQAPTRRSSSRASLLLTSSLWQRRFVPPTCNQVSPGRHHQRSFRGRLAAEREMTLTPTPRSPA